MNKMPPNPNAIIAALLDVASAAYAVNHGSHHTGKMLDEVNADDLDKLNEKLAVLETLPQMAENECGTGPARARGWLASFLVGEIALHFNPDQQKEIRTTLAQARTEPLKPEDLFAGVKYKSVLDSFPPEYAAAIRASYSGNHRTIPTRGEQIHRELENSMREYQDAELLGNLNMIVTDKRNSSVAIYSGEERTRIEIIPARGSDDEVREYFSTSFHQAIRVAVEGEYPEEPEMCAFCGMAFESPCEAPPSGPCEQANNAFHGSDPTKPRPRRDAMNALLIEVKEQYGVPAAKRIIVSIGHSPRKMADIQDDRVQAVIDAAQDYLRSRGLHSGGTSISHTKDVTFSPSAPPAFPHTMPPPLPASEEATTFITVPMPNLIDHFDHNGDLPKVEGGGGEFDGGGASGDWQ